MVKAQKSRSPIHPAVAAGDKIFLDAKDLPIIYANINPT